jgi:hypothetical protein
MNPPKTEDPHPYFFFGSHTGLVMRGLAERLDSIDYENTSGIEREKVVNEALAAILRALAK